MKRTLKLALAAAMPAALVVSAHAQDNFPDVPANHWAYEALAKAKKDGLLVGYPDGLFRGARPASRYEMAVAAQAVYTNLKNVTDGLQSQIDAIKGAGSNPDIENLKNAVTALQSDVAAMKGYGDDIANLKKMADTFEKELRSLGVDVEALKKDLADLSDRVAKLEKRKPAVDISGDVNILLLAGNSRDDLYGLDKDGHINGTTGDGATAGLTRDNVILHEAAFTLAGTNETGPKWHTTLVFSNALSAFGSQSSMGSLNGYSDATATNYYIQDLGVKFDTSVAGLAFNVEAGRVGYKVSPYLFQRPDYTSYYANERWDDGLYRFDGGILGFNFGGAKLDVFAGKNSNLLSDTGTGTTDLNKAWLGNNLVGSPLTTGGTFDGVAGAAGSVDRSLGLNLNVPLSTAGNLNLAYLWLDNDTDSVFTPDTAAAANRLAVYGGSADFAFGRIKVEGGYSKSASQMNSSNVNDDNNSAWNAKASYQGDKFKIWGGYREIENDYIAPGDWGRLGILRNPGNIKGWMVGGNIDLTPGLKLSAGGEFDKGKDDFASSPFTTDTKINSYNVKLGYNLTPSLDLSVAYEDTKFESLASNGGDTHFKWTTFGIGYGLSSSAKLSLAYEISDHDGVDNLLAGAAPIYRGGLLSTQLSIKF